MTKTLSWPAVIANGNTTVPITSFLQERKLRTLFGHLQSGDWCPATVAARLSSGVYADARLTSHRIDERSVAGHVPHRNARPLPIPCLRGPLEALAAEGLRAGEIESLSEC